MSMVPHSAAIGIQMIELADGHAKVCIPYSEHLIGDPASGVIHGGVITAALDNASGMAVHSALGRATSIATLDLRIDYMKPATPDREVTCVADCYKVTRNVAFVRGSAYHDTPDDPIATTVATFMIESNQTRKLHADPAQPREPEPKPGSSDGDAP